MHSLRSTLMALSAGIIGIMFILMAGIGVYNVSISANDSANRIMSLMLEQKSAELSEVFKSAAHGVTEMGRYFKNHINLSRYRHDQRYRFEANQILGQVIQSATRSVPYVTSGYITPEKSLFGTPNGSLCIYDEEGRFIALNPTDLSKFPQNDMYKSAKYYTAIKAHRPLWMDPLVSLDPNFRGTVISCVAPIHFGGTTVGMAGIDLNMEVIRDLLENVSYLDSFMILFNTTGNVISHPKYPLGLNSWSFTPDIQAIADIIAADDFEDGKIFSYPLKGKTQRLMLTRLPSRMVLCMSVSEKEITKDRNAMLLNMSLFFAVALLVTLLITRVLIKRIIGPLTELTRVSEQIAAGNYDVKITCTARNELGMLAESMRQTVSKLRTHAAYINSLAYNDRLLDINNNTAFLKTRAEMESNIESGAQGVFFIVMFDVNYLKQTNDRYGHKAGNELLKEATELMAKVFGRDSIYRTGGDEFVVISEDPQDNIPARLREFDRLEQEYNDTHKEQKFILSVAHGYATYDPERNMTFEKLLAAADRKMYRNKAEIKTHDREGKPETGDGRII